MAKVNGEIVFEGRFRVDKTIVRDSYADIKEHQKRRLAADLGVKIAEEKGWEEYEEDDYTIVGMKLYVFTPQELKDFVDIKFQKRLEELGVTDESIGSR